jgi:hypothetical protein
MKYFRMRGANVVGISFMAETLARHNLKANEYLLPFDPDVDWRNSQYVGGEWVPKLPEEMPVLKLRASGYPSLSDQVAVLMNMMEAIVDGRPFADYDLEEFAELRQRIAHIKRQHPKDDHA